LRFTRDIVRVTVLVLVDGGFSRAVIKTTQAIPTVLQAGVGNNSVKAMNLI